MGERFAAAGDLDTAAAAQLFYRGHRDSYDQLVFWTDTGVVTSDTFALESTVANSIQGIGDDTYDFSHDLGSGGALSRGTRHDLTIADIVAAVGARQPPASRSPRSSHQAFVYVVGPGRTAGPGLSRQAGAHPRGLGALLRFGHGRAHEPRHAPALSRR